MNKRYFQLKYKPSKQEYIVEAIPSGSKIDRTKIPDTVAQYDPYTWVCTSKGALIDKVEELKNEKLMDLEKQMKAIEDRKVVVM